MPTRSTAQYRIVAPASVASADWVNFPGAANFLDLNPASGARRDSAGSRIGIIAAGNFPGTTGGASVLRRRRHGPGRLLPGHPGPDHLRDRRPDHDGDAGSGRAAVGRHLQHVGQGRPVGRRLAGAGVDTTEYRITKNGTAGNWTTLTNSAAASPFVNTVTVPDTGDYLVEYRSTDKAANTEATKSVTFKIQLPVCDRSDEFDGNEIRPRWLRHTRNGGTPTTGPLAPTVSGGQLHLPTNDLEIDAAAATSVGPINYLAQDLPSLGTNWSVETQFTVRFTGGWQNVGLAVWVGDNNFFRSTLSHSLSGDNLYVEGSKDNPTTTEGSRATAGGNRTILPNKSQPVTIKMRYRRVDGSNSVQAHYQVVAPASVADADWVAFPGAATFLDLNPTSGVRRDSAGSRIGLIAQDNWPAGGRLPVQRRAGDRGRRLLPGHPGQLPRGR